MLPTVLITGANGFIGTHLTKLMESAGHKVIPIDVVARAPDLSLLGVKATSHLMNVTDSDAFRDLCERNDQPICFTPPTRRATRLPPCSIIVTGP
jgi:nucleoside-diphosphate-sugar epimerase